MPGTDIAPGTTPAHTLPKTVPWRTIFRVIRWATYVSAAITIAMILHKAPPPPVETNPQAAARVEQKFEQVQQAVSAGQPATMRMDQTELNSYLISHLDIAANPDSTQAQAASAPASGMPNAVQAAPPTGTALSPATSGSGQDMAVPAGTSAEQIDQVRSQVKDVKVELVGDRVRAYVVFDMHGKDVTLQLEGKLGAQDGYLNFEPVSGQIGSLPLPPSALQSAMRHILESPENREKFKLPSDMSDLKIENGEVVATYK
ncbi:MAG TPA: hypothetical protein VMP12_08530 [Candidatus Sulfotelmatobacter sp.]|nr:hypothetical protein [Candidatus Sulfotelmatobacter sp.]